MQKNQQMCELSIHFITGSHGANHVVTVDIPIIQLTGLSKCEIGDFSSDTDVTREVKQNSPKVAKY